MFSINSFTSVFEFFFIFYFYLRKVMQSFFIWFWETAYNWGNIQFSQMQDRIPFLNYGYKEGVVSANKDIDEFLLKKRESMKNKLPVSFQKVWCSTQLYAGVLSGFRGDLNGKAILEVGCGRGGGCSVVHAVCEPKTYTGIDLSCEAVKNCEEVHKGKSNRSFKVGNSMKLQESVESNTFDVVLNVESAHCYPDFQKFIQGVHYCLKPNGQFLFADLGSRMEFDFIRECFSKNGFQILAEHEITRNVTHSLKEEIAPALSEAIWKAGKWWEYPWLWLVDTQMVRAPRNCLEDGSAEYRMFVAQKLNDNVLLQ
eukprot:GDKJ01035863.1.p1 GENE.GDKJ01035863.1~~GDKJ01035863.1.p1  ORF type:complete len:312 (+),score=54.50 GDKJ01035863.1:41-976(+)